MATLFDYCGNGGGGDGVLTRNLVIATSPVFVRLLRIHLICLDLAMKIINAKITIQIKLIGYGLLRGPVKSIQMNTRR